MEKVKKAAYNKEAALSEYYNYKSRYISGSEPSNIESLYKALEDLKHKAKELGLNMNEDKEEDDLIFYYSKRNTSEVDHTRIPRKSQKMSKIDLNKMKEELDFPDISPENTLKTQSDFGMKLDLMYSNEPRSYHYEFNKQPDLLNMNSVSQDKKNYNKVLEGHLTKAFLTQVDDILKTYEDNKYKVMASFLRNGGIIKNLSVDFFFDGEKLSIESPFNNEACGYIQGINFSMNDALRTTYFETKSFEQEIKRKVEKKNVELRKTVQGVEGVGALLVCIKGNPLSLKNLKRLSLEGNVFDKKNTSGFVTFIDGCYLEYLNLKCSTWDDEEFQKFPGSLKGCKFLNKVVFNSMKTSSNAKIKGKFETVSDFVSDELGAQILQALSSSSETLIEIHFSGEPKGTRYSPSLGNLGVNSMDVILDIISQFSTLMVLRLENNKLPNMLVGKAIAFTKSNRNLRDVCFDGNTETRDVREKGGCCTASSNSSVNIEIEQRTLLELKKIMEDNGKIPVVDHRQRVIKEMLTDFKATLHNVEENEQQIQKQKEEQERLAREREAELQRQKVEDEHKKKVELLRAQTESTGPQNINISINTYSPPIVYNNIPADNGIKLTPMPQEDEKKGNSVNNPEPLKPEENEEQVHQDPEVNKNDNEDEEKKFESEKDVAEKRNSVKVENEFDQEKISDKKEENMGKSHSSIDEEHVPDEEVAWNNAVNAQFIK